VPHYYTAFALLAVLNILGAATNGPLFAATQTLVPPRMRAMSIALLYFLCNLIGMGLGPLAVGALSDALRPAFGEESLRYALLAMCPGYFWCAWHLWRASRTVASDIAAVSE
jgi:MFS family permease